MIETQQDNRPAPPPSFFALGTAGLPEDFALEDQEYRLKKVFKHDFFAATGLYTDADGQLVVLKLQRTYPLFGFPMQWLGARIAKHEISIFRQLQGIRGVPRFLGVYGPTGYVHEFIPGEDLCPVIRITGGAPTANFSQSFCAACRRMRSGLHQHHP